MGNYHGKFGFDTFSHARAVTVSSMPISVAEMMSAPFTSRDAKLFDSQVNMFRRFLKGSIRKNAKR